MSKHDNIFLIGPMGVGKTTIGRKLARKVNLKFIDADHEIEKKTGATINLIFDVEGEQGFRERETRLIDELSQMQGIVLATGGGAILSGETRDRLRQRGTVIYLSAAAELLMQRTAHDQFRPLLQTGDRLEQIRKLLDIRAPLYRQTADLVIDTGKTSMKQTVDIIMKFLETKCGN